MSTRTHLQHSASKRVVVIGPESTGKSTVSAQLAHALNEPWVREYARAYLEKIDRPYEREDLLEIARGQLQSECKALESVKNYLICDTDLHVIRVWSEHRFGHCALPVLQSIASQKTDLYLLTNIDFPWQPDPQREHPEPHWREYFFNIYKEVVVHSHAPFQILSGTPEERLQTALKAIRILQVSEDLRTKFKNPISQIQIPSATSGPNSRS